MTRFKFGCTSGAGPQHFNQHTLFEIGSISKTFTGLILAEMAQEGRVSLDDPASKYARPGAKLPKRGGETEIRLRDLVTQTSGLPRMPPKFSPSNLRNPYADYTEDRLYESLAATEIKDASGKFEYSNFGFMWLSDLVARAGGKPYENLLRERVLLPLGMRDTAITLSPEQRERFAPGHFAAYEPAPHWDFAANLGGVGAIRSSLADMIKFAGAMAGRDETPLKDAIALAMEPQRKAGGNGMIGHAWIIYERNGKRIHWHNGGTGGFRSIIAVDRTARTAAVVLVDSDTAFDDLALHLVDPASPLQKKRVAVPTDGETLKQYVGVYEITPAFALTVTVEGGKLMVQASAQRALEVARESPDVFFYYGIPAKLRFSRGADGQVDGVTLEQAGREMKGKRAPAAK